MAQDPDQEDVKETPESQEDEEEVNSDPIEQQIVAAIYDNDMDLLQKLLLEDADLNKLAAYGKKGTEKITPLFIAVSKKNLKATKLLLKFKSDPNVKSFPTGNTPLHIASMWAQHKIVALLLKNGANPVANNNKQKNPLQLIGSKYKSNNKDSKVADAKMECQILLLEAGGDKADEFQNEINDDIADAMDGLAGLKAEANQRIKKVQKASGKVLYSKCLWKCHDVWCK